MNEKRRRIRAVRAKFRAWQHVRFSKEKMKFAKGGEQNFSTQIFRIAKVIDRRPRPVFELEDLNRTPIDYQFNKEELTPARVTKSTVYKLDKIMDERVRRGIREYLVRLRGYLRDFDSWIIASSVKDFRQCSVTFLRDIVL